MLYSNLLNEKLSVRFGNTSNSINMNSISRTWGISKIAGIRRIVGSSLLSQTKESGISVKQKVLTFRKSVLFITNISFFSEYNLLGSISNKYEFLENVKFFKKGLNSFPYFFYLLLEKSSVLINKKNNIFFTVRKYFNFSVANNYFFFFLEYMKNL
jgi:hypothetical protein